MMHQRPRSRLAPSMRRLFVLGALGSLVLAGVETADARITPYHVAVASAAASTQHRIMVLVDTSASMTAPADGSGDVCVFDDCDDSSQSGMSRLMAAKAAMNQIVVATDDLVEWAFVGFERQELGNNHPGRCGGNSFEWVTTYESVANSPGLTSNANIYGYDGVWRLCGDHEGFPYLRYDNTRFGNNLPDDLSTAVTSPAAPTDAATFSDPWHASRRVQWFDEFKGVRFQPTDDDYDDSQGDYNRNQTVGETFYYWPYVDGFAGYSDFAAGGGRMGVNGVDSFSGGGRPLEFYGPLYFDQSQFNFNTNYDGPDSAEQARQALLDSLQPLQHGGVDTTSATSWSWSDAIGNPSGVPAESANSIFSSTTLSRNIGWTLDRLEQIDEACGGFSLIIISDGVNGFTGGNPDAQAYGWLSRMHEEWNVDTYVIGFNSVVSDELNRLACAGGGGCENAGGGGSCSSPCTLPSNNGFDTCADPSAPTTSCSYNASNPDELVIEFANVVAQILDVDVDSGQGAVANTFGVAGDDDVNSQTLLRAYTEVGSWEGHVTRGYCTDVDDQGVLQPYCQQPAPEFDLPDEAIDTFGGPCLQSRSWDAGECLRDTAWRERRLYSHTADNTVIEVSNPDGTATDEFRDELDDLGLLVTGSAQVEANWIVAFLLGANAPGGWKLPGVANSSPVVVKRIPPYDPASVPEVAIRDPHCGGRYYNLFDTGALPQSLYDFAQASNDEDLRIGPVPDFEYQEAVLVGDDMGVLHAFQLDSGNELWGFVPRGALANLVEQANNGPDNHGQPLAIEEHIYGLTTTVNHTWVHDPGTDDWRHLAVFGLGAGGTEWADRGTPGVDAGAEYYALDISHMSPDSPQGPIEILWTTEDQDRKDDYDPLLGQTWARPAITYWVPNEDLANPPEAYLVMGSGYAVDGSPGQGRMLVRANALTGEIVETAELPAPAHPVYESDYGTVADIAVGTHCLSRFWAESQEAYIADPAGRLFRWDLGNDQAHAADSGGPWGPGGLAETVDATTTYFPACTGAGDSCTVGTSGDIGDVFVYPPGVSANDRIDDFSTLAAGEPPGGEDQFLVALVSGSSYENTIDGFETGTDFHSSIYLLVDDHSGADKTVGFSIPADAPKSVASAAEGDDLSGDATPGYFRIALTDIVRERIAYPGATPEVRNFSRQTRPIRSPRIVVVGVVDDSAGEPEVIDGLEVYYVEFTVYEPPVNGCNTAVVDDPDTEVVEEDLGSTYVLRFRLTADTGSGFNLVTGTTNGDVDFGDGFDRGLVLDSVEQVLSSDGSGNVGPVSSPTSGLTPCDSDGSGYDSTNVSGGVLTISHSELSSFTPIE